MERQLETKWHPLHSCNDGIINTLDGAFDLVNVNPALLKIKRMAGAISKQVRFTGHLQEFYNNAQHSVLVMLLSPPKLHKPALTHDLHEAFTGDINKPMKVLLGDAIKVIERRLDVAICNKWGMHPSDFELIKQYDIQATELEQMAFQKGDRAMWDKMWMDAFGITHNLWSYDYAEQMFLIEFERLFGKEAVNV